MSGVLEVASNVLQMVDTATKVVHSLEPSLTRSGIERDRLEERLRQAKTALQKSQELQERYDEKDLETSPFARTLTDLADIISEAELLLQKTRESRIAKFRYERPLLQLERRLDRLNEEVNLKLMAMVLQARIKDSEADIFNNLGNIQEKVDAGSIQEDIPGSLILARLRQSETVWGSSERNASNNAQISDEKQRSKLPSYEATMDSAWSKATNDIADMLTEAHAFRSICGAAVTRLGFSAFKERLAVLIGDFCKYSRGPGKSVDENEVLIHAENYANAIAESVCNRVVLPTGSAKRAAVDLAELTALPGDIDQTGFGRPGPSHRNVESDLSQGGLLASLDKNAVAIFRKHGASSWLRHAMVASVRQNQVFPQARELIEATLVKILGSSTMKKRITCHLDWQVRQYLTHEFPSLNDVGEIFTISGTLDKAYAARLGDYMSMMWPYFASSMMELLHQIHRGEDKAEQTTTFELGGFSASARYTTSAKGQEVEESLDLTIEGSRTDQMVDLLELFAWITATLREPRQGQTTVSEIAFRPGIIEATIQKEEKISAHFEMSLYPLDLTIDPDQNDAGQCWTSLFSESILAYGFGTPSRPIEMVGLEVPFEAMTTAAAMRYPMKYENRIMLMGDSSILSPVKVSEDGDIQWHYFGGPNHLDNYVGSLDFVDPKTQNLDLEALENSRCFLGFCSKAVVQLGTEQSTSMEFLQSEVPRLNRTLELERKFAISLAASVKGFLNLGSSGTAHLSPREANRINDDRQKRGDRIMAAREAPMLLYDEKTSIAYLVSELSLVLHMAHKYLARHISDQSKLRMVPHAKLSADGGRAAYDAIVENRELTFDCKADGERAFLDIIDGFITSLGSRKQWAALHNTKIQIRMKHGLRGWDYVNLEKQVCNDEPRRLESGRPGGRRARWWSFGKDTRVLVIFAQGTGPIVRCSNSLSHYCCRSWSEFPTDSMLFVATVPSLIQLRTILCSGKRTRKGHQMISDKVAWVQPTASRVAFDLCHSGERCNPLQALHKPSFTEKFKDRRPPYRYHQVSGDTWLNAKGGVVFADLGQPLISDETQRSCEVKGWILSTFPFWPFNAPSMAHFVRRFEHVLEIFEPVFASRSTTHVLAAIFAFLFYRLVCDTATTIVGSQQPLLLTIKES